MRLYRQTAEAEKKAERAYRETQHWREQVEEAQEKIITLSQEVNDFREWQRLLADDTEMDRVADSETTQGSKTFSYAQFVQLRKKFLELTDRIVKSTELHSQMVEKLQERDKQIKALQRGTQSLPRTYESLSTSENADQRENLDHEAALEEIERLKKALLEKDHHVASLQTQVSSFESTVSERNKMERHSKEQSKAVMEWRKKCEHAEVL